MPILLPILLLPFVEIAILILVGNQIGFWTTFGMVVAGSLAGLMVLRGRAASAQGMLARGRGSPAVLLAQGAMTVAAGLLLLLPGLLTSAAGLLLLVPAVQRALIERIRKRILARHPTAFEAEIIEGSYSVQDLDRDRIDPPRH